MLELLSICLVILFFCFVVAGVFFKYKPSKPVFIVTSIIALIAITAIAYYTNPLPRDDLYRYFKDIDDMRNGGWYYATHLAIYRATPVINMIFYIVSLTNTNSLLTVISTFVIFAIIFKVTYDFVYKKNISIQMISLYYLVFLSMMPLRYAISGVRNQMAFAILFYGIYRSRILKKTGIINIIIYLVAASIHTSSWIIIILLIATRFKFIDKIKYFMLAGIILIGPILEILSKTGISVLVTFYEKFEVYSGAHTANIKLMSAYFIILIILFYMNSRVKRTNEENAYKEYSSYFRLYELLMLLAIASITIPTLFTRICIIIGMMSLPTIVAFFRININREKFLIFYIFVICNLGVFAFQAYDALNNWRFIS
ncbi:MAG: EpsG family protein [Sarcina sp.]